jgi:hypothetical protein
MILRFYIPFFLSFIFLTSFTSAVTLPSTQQNLEITLFQNQTFTLLLALQNNNDFIEELDLTCSGDCSMIRFGGEENEIYSISLPPHSQVLLPLIIKAKSDIGVYSANIISNNKTISIIRIYITLSPNEVLDLQKQRKLTEEINEIKDFINGLLQNLEFRINESVHVINQSIISQLHTKLENISKNIEAIESKQTELEKVVSSPTTAAIVNTSIIGGSFILGLITAFSILYIQSNRTKIKVLLSTVKKKLSKRYEFKPTEKTQKEDREIN